MIFYTVKIFKDSYDIKKVFELEKVYVTYFEILNNACDINCFTKEEVIEIKNECNRLIKCEYIHYFRRKISELRYLCEDVIKNDKILYCFNDEFADEALHFIKPFTYFKEDPNCPKCGKKMIKIRYGMPGPETLDKYEKGEIEIGGCDFDKDNPKYYCKYCEIRYCDDLKTYYKN